VTWKSSLHSRQLAAIRQRQDGSTTRKVPVASASIAYIDSQSGEIFAAPIKDGTYTAWLIAVNNDAVAAKSELPTELNGPGAA
jgi:hypothetical protein